MSIVIEKCHLTANSPHYNNIFINFESHQPGMATDPTKAVVCNFALPSFAPGIGHNTSPLPANLNPQTHTTVVHFQLTFLTQLLGTTISHLEYVPFSLLLALFLPLTVTFSQSVVLVRARNL